jgi:hypothetical protein
MESIGASSRSVGSNKNAKFKPTLTNGLGENMESKSYIFDPTIGTWNYQIGSTAYRVHFSPIARLAEFRERLAKFGLELHADKTRLIEFGRFAARDRQRRGEGKPETFTFLGFTHYCGKHPSSGAFTIWRETAKKRMVAKLHAIKAELRRRMHEPIALVGLHRVVLGYYQYPCGSGQS